MIFCPKETIKKDGSFICSPSVSASAHACLNKPVFFEFWKNFTFGSSSLTLSEVSEYIFSVGNANKLPLDGCAYSINITTDGICVYAESEKELLQGFMTLLDRLVAVDIDGQTLAAAECCQIRDRASIKNRMIHYCVFPETGLWELLRFVRFCGALRYTHIVLEFWGMLKYDCMAELSWSHGFTKEQIRPIIKEANDMGLEVIPMFNHWGHASAGRVMHGKHVVLDQDPSLQTYFSEDGWCWDIQKPKVRELLRKIRDELIELCPNGSYFHIGCDEAYGFEFTEENMALICDFINEIGNDLLSKGRRAIVWGDMFLYKHSYYDPKGDYCCNAPSAETEKYMMNRLDRGIVIADWQYDSVHVPIETALTFKNAGFDCMLCPWDVGAAQTKATLATVKDQALMGFMHTTWHTLSKGMPYVVMMAEGGLSVDGTLDKSHARTYAAALLRKVMPINGDYEKAGWSQFQIYSKW